MIKGYKGAVCKTKKFRDLIYSVMAIVNDTVLKTEGC